ncbi:MAG: hypothetical protein KIS66_07170 [Fimbriimonadaceae bacterium]|nr:hypothetical protein [Fimbriimonadaceae bacterium]
MRTRLVIFALMALSAVLSGCGGNGGDQAGTAPAQNYGDAAAGLVDGAVAVARFNNPVNVAVAADGTVYVADFDNDAIRAISPAGMVTTLTRQANFQRPFGLTVSSAGRLFAMTDANDAGARDATTGTVWEIDRMTGVATVVARNLGRPRGIAALADGRLACSDLANSTVYLLSPTTGATTPLAGMAGSAGFADGTGATARFDRPYGLAQMSNGDLLVADQNNNRLRRVTLAGVVTTFSGGASGYVEGSVAAARWNRPQAVAIAANGTIYVADHDNHRVRRIVGGTTYPFAGNGMEGYAPGTGNQASFYGMEGLAVHPNGRTLWVADGNNGTGAPYNRVRRFPTN